MFRGDEYMSKETKPQINAKKNAVIGLTASFIVVVALIVGYAYTSYQTDVRNELAKQEEKEAEAQELYLEEANTDDILNEEPTDMMEETTIESEMMEEVVQEAEVVEQGNVISEAVAFSEDELLKWPVLGGVIMNYNMDTTIYFETLDQFKVNPAMIIDGIVGEAVHASARGIVKSVEESAELGNVVVVDIGNGYETRYGQLTEINVEAGQLIEAGEAIGVIGEPSRYYTVEGPNLYFQLLKDGQPANPLDYLE